MRGRVLATILTAAALSIAADLDNGVDTPNLSPLLDSPVTRARLPGAPLPPAPDAGTGRFVQVQLNQDETTQLQNEIQIAVNPTNPDNLVAVWRDFRFGFRQVGYGASFDGGATWTEGIFVEPQYNFDSDPGITVDAAGNFYAVVLSFNTIDQPNGLFVFKSTDGGSSWSTPVEAVNGVVDVFEDKELIACDRTAAGTAGNLYVAWTRFFDRHVFCVRSTDGGASFAPPVQVSDFGNTQWPVPVVGAGGELYVAWTDYTLPAIKMDVSTDGGATFGTDTIISSVTEPGTLLGPGIQAVAFPALEADIFAGSPFTGRIYVAYMDFTEDWDMFSRYSDDGGTTWSARTRINDDAPGMGVDQFFPWLAVDETGILYAVWLDMRLWPGQRYDCYLSRSTDGGVTWEQNIRVSTVSSDPLAAASLVAQAGLLGEYIGLTARGGRVWPAWTDTRNGHQDVWVAYEPAEIAVEDAPLPAVATVLGLPRPNPFNPRVFIPLALGDAAVAQLMIANVRGAIVRRLEVRAPATGVEWDGRDDAGVEVASGVYFIAVPGLTTDKRRVVLTR